jgi:hypothetical protein
MKRFRGPYGSFNTDGETYLFLAKTDAKRRGLARDLRTAVCADKCPELEAIFKDQVSGDFVFEGQEAVQYLKHTFASTSIMESTPAEQVLKSFPPNSRDLAILAVIQPRG